MKLKFHLWTSASIGHGGSGSTQGQASGHTGKRGNLQDVTCQVAREAALRARRNTGFNMGPLRSAPRAAGALAKVSRP